MSIQMEYNSYRRDHPIDSLERQLICPICLEMFTKPVVILPCQHNLCRKCANDIFQSRGTTLGSAGRFRCPSCRHEVVLDRHGVYGLQRNLLVENIIDIYKQESASSRPLLKTEHPSCEEHEEERINIYCMTCGVPTCSLCKVFGEHKECEVAPLSDIYMKQKAALTEGIGALVATNDRIQAFIDNLQGTCRNIEDNGKAQKQALCEKFDRMYAILEERRKIMLQRITYEQEEKTQHLKSLSRSYSEHIESSSKLVDAALQSMEELQMAVFVQNAKVLIQKISELTDSREVEPLEAGYDNMEHYTVDFNAEERVLYQLDFIKVEESEEGAEDGEEDVVSGDADGAAAAPVAGGEGGAEFLALPGTGKEEAVEGKAPVLKEVGSETAGGTDAQAKLQCSAPAGELDVQAGKEAAEGAPGTNQQKDAAVSEEELSATALEMPAAGADAALSNNAWQMVSPTLPIQSDPKENALELPAESAAQGRATMGPEEATCFGPAETLSTLDSSAGNQNGTDSSCGAGPTQGSVEGGQVAADMAPVSSQESFVSEPNDVLPSSLGRLKVEWNSKRPLVCALNADYCTVQDGKREDISETPLGSHFTPAL